MSDYKFGNTKRNPSEFKSTIGVIQPIVNNIKNVIDIQDTRADIRVEKLNDIARAGVEAYANYIIKKTKKRQLTHPFGDYLYKSVLYRMRGDLIAINSTIERKLQEIDKEKLRTLIQNNRTPRGLTDIYKRVSKKYDIQFINTDRFVDAVNYILTQLLAPDPESAEDFIDTLFDPRAYDPDNTTKHTDTKSYEKAQRELISIAEDLLGDVKSLSQIYNTIITTNDTGIIDHGVIVEKILDDIYNRYVEKFGRFKKDKRGGNRY